MRSNYINLFSDPRVKGFWFESPVSITILLATYVYIVKYVLPRFMANKTPYDIKNIIIGYNIFQIVANAWFVFKMVSI